MTFKWYSNLTKIRILTHKTRKRGKITKTSQQKKESDIGIIAKILQWQISSPLQVQMKPPDNCNAVFLDIQTETIL